MKVIKCPARRKTRSCQLQKAMQGSVSPCNIWEKRHSNTFFQICRAAGLTRCRKLPASAFSCIIVVLRCLRQFLLRRIASKNGKNAKKYMPSIYHFIYAKHLFIWHFCRQFHFCRRFALASNVVSCYTMVYIPSKT